MLSPGEPIIYTVKARDIPKGRKANALITFTDHTGRIVWRDKISFVGTDKGGALSKSFALTVRRGYYDVRGILEYSGKPAWQAHTGFSVVPKPEKRTWKRHLRIRFSA